MCRNTEVQEEKVPVRLGVWNMPEKELGSGGLGKCCPRSRSRQIGLRGACCEAASHVFCVEC